MNVILKLSQDQSEKFGIKSNEDLVKHLEQEQPSASAVVPEPTSQPQAEVSPAVKTEEVSAELVAQAPTPAVTPEPVTAEKTVPAAEDKKAELEAIRTELASIKKTYQEDLRLAAATAVAEATASLGIAPLKISNAVAAKSREQVVAEYNALTDPKAKAQFFEAHQTEIFGR